MPCVISTLPLSSSVAVSANVSSMLPVALNDPVYGS